MPTYTFPITIAQAQGDLAQRIALAKALAAFFEHQPGLGVTVTNLRVQGGQIRVDTDVAISAEQLAHLGIS